MQIMDDVFEDVQFLDKIEQVCNILKPHKILTVTGQPEKLYEKFKLFFKKSQKSYQLGENKLLILSKSVYSYTSCLKRVLCLRLKTEPKNVNDAGRIIFLNSLINFSSYCVIHAIGLLLLYNDEHYGRTIYSYCSYFFM